MEYWLVDCKSTVNIDGIDVAFDFINTHFDRYKAIEEAEMLSKNDDVLYVAVHKWIMTSDGKTDHANDDDDIPYHYRNNNHREYSSNA